MTLANDRGSGLVAGIAIMFAATFLGLIWLAGTVDRGISNQSAATSIAFQSARSGAQAARVEALRTGDSTRLDHHEASAAAHATASKLLASYGVDGALTALTIDDAAGTVTAVVRIVDGSKTVTGQGSASAVEVP